MCVCVCVCVCVCACKRQTVRERPKLSLLSHLFQLNRQVLKSWTVYLPFISCLSLSLLVFLNRPHTRLLYSLPTVSLPPGLFPFISVPVFHSTVRLPTPHTQRDKYTHPHRRVDAALHCKLSLVQYWSPDFNHFPLELNHNHLTLLPACLGAPHRCLNCWPTYLSFSCVCPHKWKPAWFLCLEKNWTSPFLLLKSHMQFNFCFQGHHPY